MSTLTVFPDAGTGATTCDAIFQSEDTTWAAAHDATTASVNTTVTSHTVRAAKAAANDWFVRRDIATYDTSPLTSAATISGAVYSLCAEGFGTNNGDTSSTNIVASTPATNNNIVADDFDQVGTTVFGTQLISAWTDTDGTYNDFTLDANGIANISKTGISRFGVRNSRDTTNSGPAGDNAVRFYSADTTGTTKDPKLVITYTTVTLPTTTTQAVSSIAQTTATGNGNITATGGENPSERGVVWSTTTHGDPGNTAPGSSAYSGLANETGGSFGTGAFTESITGLSTSTTYYVRAYSKNSVGYAYGGEVSFTTFPPTLTLSVSDDVTVSESSTVTVNLNPNVNDSVTVSESVVLDVKLQPIVSDSVTVSESITLSFPLLETLVDNFDDDSTNPGKWTKNTGGTTTITEVSEAVTVAMPAAATSSDIGEYRSVQKFNLTASYGFLEVSIVPNNRATAFAHFELFLDTNNYIRWVFNQTSLIAQKNDGGVSTDLVTLTYDPAVHVWWRIRESGGTVYFDTSVDTLSWTNQTTTTLTQDITQYQVRVGAYCTDVTVTPGNFTFDDFNYAVIFPVVNDSVTVSESISTSFVNELSVNDTVTVSESVTVKIANLGDISVNDTVTISENFGSNEFLFINVSEAVINVEDVVILMNLADLIVHDNVIVSESVTTRVDLNISVNDAITVSESFPLTLFYNISVNDSVTVTESVVGSLGLGDISVNDTVTVTENIIELEQLFINVSDSITVTENIQEFEQLFINVNDSVTMSESATIFFQFSLFDKTVAVGTTKHNSIPTSRSYN